MLDCNQLIKHNKVIQAKKGNFKKQSLKKRWLPVNTFCEAITGLSHRMLSYASLPRAMQLIKHPCTCVLEDHKFHSCMVNELFLCPSLDTGRLSQYRFIPKELKTSVWIWQVYHFPLNRNVGWMTRKSCHFIPTETMAFFCMQSWTIL